MAAKFTDISIDSWTETLATRVLQSLAAALEVPIGSVTILEVSPGSVTVQFSIATESVAAAERVAEGLKDASAEVASYLGIGQVEVSAARIVAITPPSPPPAERGTVAETDDAPAPSPAAVPIAAIGGGIGAVALFVSISVALIAAALIRRRGRRNSQTVKLAEEETPGTVLADNRGEDAHAYNTTDVEVAREAWAPHPQ